VQIIEEAEQRQRNAASGLPHAPVADDVFRAIESGESDRAIRLMQEDPLRIHTRHIPSEASPLHAAAQALDSTLVRWLLDHDADPRARMRHGITPIDAAAHRWYRSDTQRFETVAHVLLDSRRIDDARGGRRAWRHQLAPCAACGGTLTEQNDGSGGLLRIAVTHNRPNVLDLILTPVSIRTSGSGSTRETTRRIPGHGTTGGRDIETI
jgi:hypothetical protein